MVLVFERHTGWTGDPFWDAVRRRRPDLRLVLLPPEPTPVPGAEALVPAPDAAAAPDAALSEDDVLAGVRDLEVLVRALAVVADPAQRAGLGLDSALRPRRGSVSLIATAVLRGAEPDADDPLALLDRLGTWLAAPRRGWRVHVAPGAVTRLDAVRSGISVRATANPAAGVSVIEAVRSFDAPVARAEARRWAELVAGRSDAGADAGSDADGQDAR